MRRPLDHRARIHQSCIQYRSKMCSRHPSEHIQSCLWGPKNWSLTPLEIHLAKSFNYIVKHKVLHRRFHFIDLVLPFASTHSAAISTVNFADPIMAIHFPQISSAAMVSPRADCSMESNTFPWNRSMDRSYGSFGMFRRLLWISQLLQYQILFE